MEHLPVHLQLQLLKLRSRLENTPTPMAFTHSLPICLTLLLLTARTLAQCSDPTFQPCSAPDDTNSDDAGSIDAADLDTFLGALDGAAGVSDDESDEDGPDKRRLFRRQDDDGLCCNPSVQCLVTDGVPFCYV